MISKYRVTMVVASEEIDRRNEKEVNLIKYIGSTKDII